MNSAVVGGGSRGKAWGMGLLVAVLLVGLLLPVVAQDVVVATVDGDKITEAQLQAAMRERYGTAMRETMIGQLMVEQAAQKRNVVVTDQDVAQLFTTNQTQIDEQLKPQGGDFAAWLLRQGHSEASYRRQLRMQLLLEKMVASQVRVTDADVADFYEKNREQLTPPEGMQVSQISVATKEEADRIRADLVATTITWNDAAKQYNLDPYGRDNGGLLGVIAKGSQPAQVTAFSLQQDGEISQPYQDQMGWHLMRREAYQASVCPPLDQIQEQLRQRMTREETRYQAQQMLEALLKIADIKRLGDLPAPGV